MAEQQSHAPNVITVENLGALVGIDEVRPEAPEEQGQDSALAAVDVTPDVLQQAFTEAAKASESLEEQPETDSNAIPSEFITADGQTMSIMTVNGELADGQTVMTSDGLMLHIEGSSLMTEDGQIVATAINGFINGAQEIQDGEVNQNEEIGGEESTDKNFVEGVGVDGETETELPADSAEDITNKNVTTENLSSNDLPTAEKMLEDDDSTTTYATLRPKHIAEIEKAEDPQAAVGSSKNPIQIIQHGNTYTSTQVLTAEQLQQIAQVLQQQHLIKAASKQGGRSVLYNSQTNTRIVYRVIYPSDLHKKRNNSDEDITSDKIVTPMKRGRGRPRKIRPEDEQDVPGLTRAEKEQKKKHCPITRSGRISRPPAHMRENYKRIHPVDLDEDAYDDSDGGYSDYNMSDEERKKTEEEESRSSLGGRPRKWKCETCFKSYIGRGSLARHYKMFPDHGTLPPEENESGDLQSMESDTSALQHSDASNMSIESTPVPTTAKFRRPYKNIASTRRKNKLRHVASLCNDDELMEIVLSRISNAITLWDFLLVKSEREDEEKHSVTIMLQELDKLLQAVRIMAHDNLMRHTGEQEDQQEVVEITDEKLANCLGVEVGSYAVKSSSLSYNSLNRNPSFIYIDQSSVDHSEKAVTKSLPDAESLEPHSKRLKVENEIVDKSEEAVGEKTNDKNKTCDTTEIKTPESDMTTTQTLSITDEISSLLKPENNISSSDITSKGDDSVTSVTETSKLDIKTPILVSESNFSASVPTAVSASHTSVLDISKASLSTPVSANSSTIEVPSSSIIHGEDNQRYLFHNGQLFMLSNEDSLQTGDSDSGADASEPHMYEVNHSDEHTEISDESLTTREVCQQAEELQGKADLSEQIDGQANLTETNGDSLLQENLSKEMLESNAVLQEQGDVSSTHLPEKTTFLKTEKDFSEKAEVSEQAKMLNGVQTLQEDSNLPERAEISKENLSEEAATLQMEIDMGEQADASHIKTDLSERMPVLQQMADGTILLQKEDGTIIQLQSDGDSIPIETIQALLASN